MAISTFGVAHGDVQTTYFPQLGAFTLASNPSHTTVARFINEESARLMGALAREGLSASALAADTTTAAYVWCAETIRLGAAVKTYSVMSQANPEVLKTWRDELNARYERLDEDGYLALGDAPAPAQDANGPRTHISELGLDTGDDADASDAIPIFRKDDLL